MALFDGIRVVDLSTLFAGPFVATLLGDHGADVVKIEHPRGDDARRWGESKDGVPLWWKVISRNKRLIALDLHAPEGQDIVKALIARADVVVENFRPGRLESWGLGWHTLHALNPRLIMVQMTGFGQEGPYSGYPGFGTLAEAMSGFAAVTGHADGPPTLPSFGLADGIAGIAGAFAVAGSLYKREHTGHGELIDVALYEPLMWIVGAHLVEYDQLQKVQQRNGNQSPRTSPRNTYKTKDNRWIALSASAESIAGRVFAAIGQPELVNDPRFRTNRDRVRHRDEVDGLIAAWAQTLTQEEALQALRAADAAVAPVYDASQAHADVHFRARGSVATYPDDDLGAITMQGVFPRLLNNPASVRWTGHTPVGAATDDVLSELGFSTQTIEEWRQKGVIR
jgi:crotonobetainyl-CoA:carnitine CoA-transferase CaiB-like acyl-CoA transferase